MSLPGGVLGPKWGEEVGPDPSGIVVEAQASRRNRNKQTGCSNKMVTVCYAAMRQKS